jgi:release factor glutamine methyltransferase
VTGAGAESRNAHLPGQGESWTPIRLTRWSGGYLEEKGVENGRLEAELLLAHVLGTGRLELYLQFDRPIQPQELAAFKSLLLRRVSREPLQYILGTTAFRELDLRVDARALIPRPETEVLVEEVLVWAASRRGPLTGLDIGTGTGAIALSLLREGPFESLVATDPSPHALELATENAASLGLADRIEFREGSLFGPVNERERFDLVVSNPPYVPEEDRGTLQPEVLDWEPPGALFAGPRGMDVLEPLARGAPAVLKPEGLFAVEVGDGQARPVAGIMEGTRAFSDVWTRPDLTGRDRIVLGVAS